MTWLVKVLFVSTLWSSGCARIWSLQACANNSYVCLLGVEFFCPVFRDGENVVTCVINRTAIEEAECSSVQEFVTFERTANSSSLVKCYTQSFDPSSCNSDLKPAAGSCWCDETDGEIFVYKFAYIACRSHDEGAQMECKICHRNKKYLHTTESEGCRKVSFAGSPNSGGGDGNVTWTVSVIAAFCITVAVVLS